MKSIACCRDPHRNRAAFTLSELLVAMTILSLLVAGLLSANLFGMRTFGISQRKLALTDEARCVIGKMSDEIRNAKAVSIGNFSNGSFAKIPEGLRQDGSAIMAQVSANTNDIVLYFVDPSDQKLRRAHGNAAAAEVIARSLANTLAFQARDYLGNVLTNNRNVRLLRVNLQFFEPQICSLSPESYRVETCITRRAE